MKDFKKIFSCILALCLLTCTLAVPVLADATTNLALNKTASSPNIRNNSPVVNATDGNAGTYWRSNGIALGGSTYIQVDLGAEIAFDKVKFASSTFLLKSWASVTAPSTVRIDAANDAGFATGMVTCATINITSSATTSYEASFTTVKKRYVRLTYTRTMTPDAPNTTVDASLSELEVYNVSGGTGEGEVEEPVNLLLGKTASAQDPQESGKAGSIESMTDGDAAVYYRSAASRKSAYVAVDMGESKKFNKAVMAFGSPFSAKSYPAANNSKLIVSVYNNEDASDIKEVATLNLNSQVVNTVYFDVVNKRYIRFTLTSDMDAKLIVGELYAYNIPAVTVAKTVAEPVIYVPHSGTKVYGACGLTGFDASNNVTGNNLVTQYGITDAPQGISINSATGEISVSSTAEGATLTITATFPDNAAVGPITYTVAVLENIANNISVNPLYAVVDDGLYDADGNPVTTLADAAKYRIKAMSLDNVLPQSIDVMVVEYTDSTKSTLAEINIIPTRALEYYEFADISIDVSSIDETNAAQTSIFLWSGLDTLSPITAMR